MKEIKLKKDSNNIKSIFYDEAKKELLVFFNSSSCYSYKDISEEEFVKMSESKDVGLYFYENIRTKKKFDKKY